MGKTSFHGKRGFPLPPNPLPFSRKAEYCLLPLVANRGETVQTPFHIGGGRYYAFILSRASIARSIAPRWQEMAAFSYSKPLLNDFSVDFFPFPQTPFPFSRKAEYFLLPLVANRGETVHTPFHIGSGRYYAFKLSRASIARSIAPR